MKRTATIVLVGGALAAWFAGAATSNRALPTPIIPKPAAIDASGAALAGEIARLHERLRPSTTPRTPSRNLFTFRAVPAPAAPLAAPRAALSEMPVAFQAPTMPSLKLAGISEDSGDSGPVRQAFISGEGQLFIVKEGEAVTARYKVARISSEVVELTDLTDNTTRRLALK
ncbi:MAG TPA: hypothetical protein VF219_15015 [Vicinamibacterales bacterium]